MSRIEKRRIGEYFVDAGVLTQEQVDRVLFEQTKTKGHFGEVLLKIGLLDEETFVTTLAKQIKVPLLDLKQVTFDPATIQLIPESFARTYKALAIEMKADHVVVGMEDPSDINALDALSKLVPLPIEPVLVRPSELRPLFNLFYQHESEIAHLASSVDILKQEAEKSTKSQPEEIVSSADAPVVRMVNLIFEDAIRKGASDIHIEPDDEVLRIRIRVDGILHEQVLQQNSVASMIASRLKTLAGLNISEQRLPQDGHFDIYVSGKKIDVRLSTMPIQYGESVVMRLLDQSSVVAKLDQLGMPAEMLSHFRYQSGRPHGMILVTGPTGSGKTTTLNAALRERNSPEEKIITVEDPVEYKLSRVNQIQINSQIGLDFPRVLRSALRQDPDVILIGEIRDHESMEIALRASMTGHLVLSTLHTNSAISTISRLIDLGSKGYLLASTLRAVVAQRLVRKICTKCTQEVAPVTHEKIWVDSVLGERAKRAQFMQGKGCSQCMDTGYSGRIGVFEMIVIDEQLKIDLNREDIESFERHANAQDRFSSVLNEAMELALSGVTSIEEVMRVTDGLISSIHLVEENS